MQKKHLPRSQKRVYSDNKLTVYTKTAEYRACMCPRFPINLAGKETQHFQFHVGSSLTLNMPEDLNLYGLYVYYLVQICDFGTLRVNDINVQTVLQGSLF